jgi:hypothetical protein
MHGLGTFIASGMAAVLGCQIFLGTKYQSGGKKHHMTKNIPNWSKIYQPAIKYIYQRLQFQVHFSPKFTQIGIFCHLATLLQYLA